MSDARAALIEAIIHACDGLQEYLQTSVVADCDTPQILEAIEHDFDPVMPFVVTLVVFDSLRASPSTLETGAYPFFF